MKSHLPFALITLRLLLGPVALVCALANVLRWIYLPILVTGTLSDIYDDILARGFGSRGRAPHQIKKAALADGLCEIAKITSSMTWRPSSFSRWPFCV